jgi:mannose-6-phosphate isomerase-like protein (cupin superfamily)
MKTANKFLVLSFLFILISESDLSAQSGDEVGEILQKFALDYRSDPTFSNQSFGVEVDEEMWSVTTSDAGSEKKTQVTKGSPDSPTFYYVTNLETLRLIEAGKLNAMTAGVKAFSTDYAPFDIEVMEGFQPNDDFVGEVLAFTFHFWTRGIPEIIPFGPHYTRTTHGAQAAVFYYDKGLRTGYGYIHPGQHANENPKSKTNPFSSMIIVIKGKIIARLDGTDHTIERGNAFFIPAGMSHEVLNPFDEGGEIILLMFGEGA